MAAIQTHLLGKTRKKEKHCPLTPIYAHSVKVVQALRPAHRVHATLRIISTLPGSAVLPAVASLGKKGHTHLAFKCCFPQITRMFVELCLETTELC